MTSTADAREDAVRLAEVIRDGERSPVEVIDDTLERIRSSNPAINACTFVLEDEARAGAEAAERELHSGGEVGPLLGVPVAIKDHIWVKGVPTTLGSLAYRVDPPRDAVVVERLRRAGAIVVAKTATTEFCYGIYSVSPAHGITRNPVDQTRTVSGSSGGSAAAVAAGMVPIALGSDAGGSIRIPASFCGIAGFKPSHGMYPLGPGWTIARSVQCIGPLARSVRDLRLLHQILKGPDPSDDQTLPSFQGVGLGGRPASELRVAWSVDLGFANVDAPVRSAFFAAIERLRQAGWRLEEAYPAAPSFSERAMTIYSGEVGSPPEGREHMLRPELLAYLTEAAKTTALDYYDAREWQTSYAESWERFFTEYDAILTPSVTLGPFSADPSDPIPVTINGTPISDETDAACEVALGELTIPANLFKGPAVTVPIGRDPSGLPMGLQVMCRRFGDELCLDIAEAIEKTEGRPFADSVPHSQAGSAVVDPSLKAS